MESLFYHVQQEHRSFPRVNLGKKHSTCRFCGSSVSTFNNRSHTLPEFLGNKTVFNLDECDQCNAFFGQEFEPNLKKFLPPSWYCRTKGKKGYVKSTVSNNTVISANGRGISVNVAQDKKYLEVIHRGSKYNSLLVYKSLLKILISLVPTKYIDEFSNAIDWLMNADKFETLVHKPIVSFAEALPDSRRQDQLEIILVREAVTFFGIYELQINFNNCRLKLPFSPMQYCHFDYGSVLPARNHLECFTFQEIDFSNYSCKHAYVLKIDSENSRIDINKKYA